jgi:hypothetical protein
MTQDGAVPAQSGPSRGPADRPAGDGGTDREPVTLHPADLSVALRAAVSGVGAAGPPAGGLARVRRKARIRQRNRAMLAGTAGLLVIVMGVTVATGGRLNLVPSLTGVVGLGNSGGGPRAPGGQAGENPSAAGETSRPVWPWTGPSSNATGPALGPGAPAGALPSSPGAAQTALCTAAILGISTSLGVTRGDTRYGVIDVTPQSTCLASDPPVVEVTNAAGNAAASVQILPADQTAAPGLPVVTAAGSSMVLQADSAYEFQFAWVAPACPPPAAAPSPTADPGDSPPATAYALRYSVPGNGPVPGVTLDAACGAQVYVTDVYLRGVYPTPTPTPAPTAPPTVSSPSPPPPPPTAPATPPDTSSPEASLAATSPPTAADGAGRPVTVPVIVGRLKSARK